jgi:hypothetical protein
MSVSTRHADLSPTNSQTTGFVTKCDLICRRAELKLRSHARRSEIFMQSASGDMRVGIYAYNYIIMIVYGPWFIRKMPA